MLLGRTYPCRLGARATRARDLSSVRTGQMCDKKRSECRPIKIEESGAAADRFTYRRPHANTNLGIVHVCLFGGSSCLN